MNFVKSFWSSVTTTSPNGEVVQHPPNPIHATQPANFNSVSFTTTTTTAGNSIIITTVPATPQNTQGIVYHNQNITDLKPSQMASPTDSFHSTTSNFDQQNNGKINLAYNGSSSEINNNSNADHIHIHHHHSNSNRGIQSHGHNQVVVREQYWSWNWPWQRWNSREKIFLIVIIVLSLCVLTLTSILSVVLQKNFQYRDMLISKLGDDAASIFS
ncbi:uncharacterized protein [Chironomus tepperi]|uniref:uncharacterized protein n=1 Tax=Chironomus tepperi TaxID=113505 RepID=UPI00391F8093